MSTAKKTPPVPPPKPADKDRKASVIAQAAGAVGSAVVEGISTAVRRLSFTNKPAASASTPTASAPPPGFDDDDEAKSRILSESYDIETLRAAMVKEEHEQVWVPMRPVMWALGEVVAVSKDLARVTVQLDEGVVTAFLREEVRGFDAAHLDAGVHDLGAVNDLNEAAVLSVLHLRHKKQEVYTALGDILISVNPYATVVLSDDAKRPNINNTARAALDCAKAGSPASLLCNGDSGSGKTEATKIAMRLLVAGKAVTSESAEVRRAIAQVTPLLEAFGNACTVQNKNSSRFGKFSEILFNKGDVAGSRVRTFLFESGRAVARAPGERNFHFFYQLCAGLDSKTKAAWGVQSDPNQHAYLHGYVEDREDEEAPSRFLATSAAMEAVGLNEAQRKGLFAAVAIVLRLGDVVFDEVPAANSDPGSKVRSGAKELSAVLGLPEDQLQKLLTVRTITAGGSGANKSSIEVPMSPTQARESRDSMARLIYAGIFNMVLDAANTGCAGSSTHDSYVGVLDMMGFEVLPDNSFEQLLINSASEELQAVFNASLVQSERRAYTDEGVDSSKLDLKDNAGLLAMFREDLFPALDEQTSMATGTDALFLTKLGASKSQDVCLDPLVEGCFIVKHFAGPVTYVARGLVEKNKAAVFGSLMDVLIKASAQPFSNVAAQVFAVGSTGGKLATMVPSVSKRFRQSMDEMMASIARTTPFFIRCVKPNTTMSASEFNRELVYDQLLRLGVFEAVRLRREGFPLRLPFSSLIQSFPLLASVSPSSASDKEKAERILIEGLGEAVRGKTWQLGTSQAFLGPRALIDVGHEVRKRETEADLRRRLEEMRAADEARRAAEAKALAEKRAAEEKARREAEEARQREEERQRLERQAKEEETRRRKQEMELEAKRAEAERRRRAAAGTKIASAARGFLARKRYRVLLRNDRRRRAATKIQALGRMRMVRLRYERIRENTQPWSRGLRKGEIVLLSSLVVRVQVHDLLRAVDEIVGAKGKVIDQAKKVDKAVAESQSSVLQQVIGGFTNTKKRYSLLLTRNPRGTCSLVLMDPATFKVVDEFMLDKSVRAMSTTTRDFVLQRGEETWCMTDLLGGAVGWVNLLKQDLPPLLALLKPGGKTLQLRGAEVMVKQGYLNLKRGETKKWDKRWFVLEQGSLKWFKGQKNTMPSGQLVINEYSATKVPRGEDGKAFVIAISTFEESVKIQCADSGEFQAWLGALSFVVDIKKKGAEEEKIKLTERAIAAGGQGKPGGGDKRSELARSVAAQRDSAALTLKVGVGKAGKFDAGAFKSAFKDRDVVNTSNW